MTDLIFGGGIAGVVLGALWLASQDWLDILPRHAKRGLGTAVLATLLTAWSSRPARSSRE